MMKIMDSTMGRVEVGKISEAIKFAEEEAGEPNMKIAQMSSSKDRDELTAKQKGSKMPVVPSELSKVYMLRAAFFCDLGYRRRGRPRWC